MTVGYIIILLECCLKNTYILFQGRLFEQIEGTDMGSPIRSIVDNLYMEDIETRVI